MAWYEYPSNWSGGQEVTGLGTLMQYSNYVVNGYLGIGMILLVWLLTFGFSLASGSRKALLVSSFISFILSIFLWRLQILPMYVPIALIVMVVIGAIFGKDETTL
jgi:phosphoglycerol transferase MdoB-like AlkP superfamily enzyme